MPWDFPLWQWVRFGAPSLMVGNTSVFKPSTVSPQSGLELQEVFESTGVPPGTFNVVLGSSEVASYLIEANTAAISFTGSVPAGQDVATQASNRLKKVVLELGGSDPFIVLEDADVEASSTGAVAGRFINNAHSSISANPLLLAHTIAHQLLDP